MRVADIWTRSMSAAPHNILKCVFRLSVHLYRDSGPDCLSVCVVRVVGESIEKGPTQRR